jgi:hypothetical protein
VVLENKKARGFGLIQLLNMAGKNVKAIQKNHRIVTHITVQVSSYKTQVYLYKVVKKNNKACD